MGQRGGVGKPDACGVVIEFVGKVGEEGPAGCDGTAG